MMKNKISFADYEPKDCREVFSVIMARQITALMFHDEMADLFDFLGLRGFKRMHEYQYLAESAEHRGVSRYYMNHHGMLLDCGELDPITVIPDDWYKYTRDDVSATTRQQAVQRAMQQYRQWETDTKALYEKCAAHLISWKKIADFNKVNDLIKDVDEELKYLERLCLELQAVDYDCSYIETLQDKYHEKYKEKCKEIGIDIC